MTDGKGVDHIVEVGSMGTIEQSIRSTKQGGLISLVGFLASSEATHIVPSLIYGGKTGRSPRVHDEWRVHTDEVKHEVFSVAGRI